MLKQASKQGKPCTFYNHIFNSVCFQGPDALWDYRTKQPDYTRYIGATSPALEGTSDLDYLLRPSSHNPTVPAHRHCYAGEIGWGVKEFSHLGKRNLLSGMQITVP